MVDEPPQLILAYVAHYLALGASGIHLCLDRRQDKLVEILRAIPNVSCTVLDEAYWQARGMTRPKRASLRQSLVCTEAAKSIDCDFLFHVDADEYLIPARPIGEQLSEAPEGITNLYFRPFERIVPHDFTPATSIFAGRYKVPKELPPEVHARVWGEDAEQLSNNGFHGHVLGKSFIRLGQGEMSIQPHFGLPADTEFDLPQSIAWFRENSFLLSGHLLHFDGLTPLNWAVKLMRKKLPRYDTESPTPSQMIKRRRREQQVRLLDGLDDPARIVDLARRVQTLSPEQEALIEAQGNIIDIPHDIEATARRLFADRKIDFSMGAFDRSLRKRFANSPYADWMAAF